MDEKRTSLIGLHAASVLFGVTGLFSKIIPLPSIDITSLRSLIAAAALFCLVRFLRGGVGLESVREYTVMALAGMLMCLHWVTFFHAMQVSSVAVGMIALFSYPVMTVFLEPLWQGQRPRVADVAAGIGVLLGVYLMVPSFSPASSITLGVFWGCVSAFLFALRNVLQRRYLAHCPGDTSMFYQTLIAGIAAFPFIRHSPASLAPSVWAQLGLLALFFTAVPHSLFAGSLRHLTAKSASLIGCLQPLYSTVFACIILGEIPSPATVLGGLIIVGAAAFESARQ
jgi:drug/metabolite transporter (DMT)-like permease